jgi:hypothetical protein
VPSRDAAGLAPWIESWSRPLTHNNSTQATRHHSTVFDRDARQQTTDTAETVENHVGASKDLAAFCLPATSQPTRLCSMLRPWPSDCARYASSRGHRAVPNELAHGTRIRVSCTDNSRESQPGGRNDWALRISIAERLRSDHGRKVEVTTLLLR